MIGKAGWLGGWIGWLNCLVVGWLLCYPREWIVANNWKIKYGRGFDGINEWTNGQLRLG